jgi:Flp pilus assembly pilin Flp
MAGQRTMSKLKQFLHAVRGNAGVEFALLLPLLSLLLFGSIEVGRALHDYHVVTQSVRDGARYLSRLPFDCSGAAAGSCSTCNAQTGVCSGGGCTLTDPAGVLEGVSLAMTGTTDGGDDLLGYWPHPPASASNELNIQVCAVSNAGGTYSGLYEGMSVVPRVRVEANVDFEFLFGQLVSSNSAIDFEIAHNVVVVGR